MTTTLDIAALAAAITWPLMAAVAILLLRKELPQLVRRIKAFSIGSVQVELSDGRKLNVGAGQAAVDLRKAGGSNDVNDSTLRSFYEQVRDTQPLDYAVVDLGQGNSWLTSRLFILAVILRRMRALETVVFVASDEAGARRFVGLCDTEQLRWRLAGHYPWLEAALALAETRTWFGGVIPPTGPGVGADLPVLMSSIRVVGPHGRLEPELPGLEPAPELLRYFLDAVQSQLPPPTDDWETLPESPSAPAVIHEHAQWLTRPLLQSLLDDALRTDAVLARELRGKPTVDKARLIVDQQDRWVAVTRDDGAVSGLVDRHAVLEQVSASLLED